MTLDLQTSVSFNNTRSFLKHINSLYSGPAWTCELIDIEGDVMGEDGTWKQETVELW